MPEEPTPGLIITPWLPDDAMYVIDRTVLGEQGQTLVVPEAVWERLSGAQQEELRDMLTRREAERGQAEIERWLRE